MKTHYKRLPQWIKNENVVAYSAHPTRKLLRKYHLHSVCEEARCPNRGECFSRGTATFLILGKQCTRQCRFCAVGNGPILPPDPLEPRHVAEAVRDMGIHYAVITSVTRDDLTDGGAEQFAKTIKNIKALSPKSRIEVLVPDFKGSFTSIDTVLLAGPDVFNHNVETVPRLYSKVRPMADYKQSLGILEYTAKNSSILIKSGLMVGLGETTDEVLDVMKDLYTAGVSILTIGQYLQPTRNNLPVERFVTPEEFHYLRVAGFEIGFDFVFSAPLVRSSYMAESVFKKLDTAPSSN